MLVKNPKKSEVSFTSHLSLPSPVLLHLEQKMPGLKHPWKKKKIGDATALGDGDGKLCVFLRLPLPMEKSIGH